MNQIKNDKSFDMQLATANFSERLRMLTIVNKKKKIVYIKNEFDNSTFRYRCYNFMQSLEKSKTYEIIHFLNEEIPIILKFIKKIDLIIFQRASWTIEIENLVYLAKINNIKVIYDIDDMIFKADFVPQYINHIGEEFDSITSNLYFSIATNYDMVAKKCDAYITTTNHLKNQLEKNYNKPAFVIHNFLNDEQISESNYIIKKRKQDDSKFMIGYFSGSPSHKNDFKLIEKDLIKLLGKYDDIYLKIVGFMNLDEELRKYQDIGRIIFKELVPYQQLQYEIAEVDVNIIPLVDNDFNQSKSELKFFEAGIVKVPSCVTPTNLYQEIINNHENGIFCSQGEWFNNLEKLYLDRNLLKQIGENAYQTTKKLYFPKHHKTTIENVYDELLKQN